MPEYIFVDPVPMITVAIIDDDDNNSVNVIMAIPYNDESDILDDASDMSDGTTSVLSDIIENYEIIFRRQYDNSIKITDDILQSIKDNDINRFTSLYNDRDHQFDYYDDWFMEMYVHHCNDDHQITSDDLMDMFYDNVYKTLIENMRSNFIFYIDNNCPNMKIAMNRRMVQRTTPNFTRPYPEIDNKQETVIDDEQTTL